VLQFLLLGKDFCEAIICICLSYSLHYNIYSYGLSFTFIVFLLINNHSELVSLFFFQNLRLQKWGLGFQVYSFFHLFILPIL